MNKNVFVGLIGAGKTKEEIKILKDLIEMILCLEKHKNIRKCCHEG